MKYLRQKKHWSWLKRSLVLFVAVVMVATTVAVIYKPSPVAAANIALNAQASNVGNNVSSVTVTKPAGTVLGTLLLAQVTFYNTRSTVTVTAPAGWTHLGTQITTNSRYQNVYYKVATGAEPANYTWTFSRSSYIAIGVSDFSGVSTASPVEASATQLDTSSTTLNAPSVNTGNSNDMLVSFWGYGRQITASSYSAGMTSLLTTSTTNIGIGQAYKLLPTAGASGTTSSTVTSSSTADAHTLALRPASAPVGIVFVATDTPVTCTGCTTLSPAAPTGWTAGDFFITNVSWSTSASTLTAPSGWTQIDTTTTASGYSEADFYHFAVSGDPASYTWTFSASTGAVMSTVDFSGVDPLAPLDVSGVQSDGNATSHNAPSVTTTNSSDLLFDVWTYEYGLLASTHSASQTQVWSARSGSNAGFVGVWSGYETVVNAAATGTRNTTISSSRGAMMHSIALKPFIPVPVLDAPIDGDVGIYQLTQFQLKNVSLTASPLRYVISLCSDSACASVLATYDQTTSQTGWSGQDALAGTAYVGGTTLGGSTEAVYTETSPLANGTQYWWRARSFDTSSGTYSLLSTISTFTTNYVPAAPTLYNPPVTGSSVTPEFQLATIDGDSDNVQYKIQICTNSTCTAIFKTLDQTATQVGWSGQDGDTDTTYGTDPISATNSTLAYYNYTLLDLTPNIQYWWRAYAIDPAGSITWSPASTIRSFVTNTVEVRILSGRIMSGVIK